MIDRIDDHLYRIKGRVTIYMYKTYMIYGSIGSKSAYMHMRHSNKQ